MVKRHDGRAPWLRFAGVGFDFAAAVVCFVLVGWWIDRHYGCGPWGVLVGAGLGLVGGTYNLIRQGLAATKEAAKYDHDSRDESSSDQT